ncbi:AN1-type zinc finger protein 4 [Dermacentor silvarum]|uniref:AN1-type zinc finger protein 4 n=1 Tax=Dermacentor silvarum TaxID=543639 RepID=UPI0021014E64|nr:AN1-type zinc finger protein 4 [Dermacentor silvarum]
MASSDVIEVFIETLHGTAFELLVSPADTVVSIKSRISRLEGIPVSQQHLIWQCQELPDDSSLHECNITDGATIKLVLGMRGGPINTRKAYLEERPTLNDVAKYLDTKGGCMLFIVSVDYYHCRVKGKLH